MSVDKITKRWIRNASDERAASRGCFFDEERGQFVVDWIADYLCLYEGDFAGQPFILHDDWQYEAVMRLFGWARWSDHWGRNVRRFTRAGFWVPKKNKKSPTLAALATYTFAGDGEMGQHVFLAAKDGQQARDIAGKHVIEMITASPRLMAECKINLNEMCVTHGPTRSTLKPLSSSNSQTQQAKEGLNGSIFCDETHVVDRGFVNRISRAGISRSEPLFVQLSTAGNNPAGYGKSEFDYGQRVESGEENDDSYLFIGYCAPQDLSDEDLAADPIKYGRMANPAWGHTVSETEFLADYHRSRASLSDLADFKMYRLNIWQGAENPWLKPSDWAQCRDDFTLDELLGRECWGGLDLAKTRDMTALVLLFDDGDDEEGRRRWLQFPFYWLPRPTAERLRDDVPLLDWADKGHLTLIDGQTCDYGFIRKQILDVFEKFDVQQIAYDDHYADQLIDRLIDEDGLSADSFVEFPQTMSNFAGATAAYERAVIDKTLRHNGHPVLTWQAANVRVKEDANGNMRPVKQKRGDYRTVDGIVAGIMALAVADKPRESGWNGEIIYL